MEKNLVAKHYDILIDENNDPVLDSDILKEYMDEWDGPLFIEKMQLNQNKKILEIGVGTGRIALQIVSKCQWFFGIDLSRKTIERAFQHLANYANVTLIWDDVITYHFDTKFDVIYSTLTFMHIKEKEQLIKKINDYLQPDGLFVLSIDKNQTPFIDIGSNKIEVYPDQPENIQKYIQKTEMEIIEIIEKERAYIFVCRRGKYESK